MENAPRVYVSLDSTSEEEECYEEEEAADSGPLVGTTGGDQPAADVQSAGETGEEEEGVDSNRAAAEEDCQGDAAGDEHHLQHLHHG